MKQAAANKANATLSTGPRTAQGKSASSAKRHFPRTLLRLRRRASCAELNRELATDRSPARPSSESSTALRRVAKRERKPTK
jgi:hypothetical protein